MRRWTQKTAGCDGFNLLEAIVVMALLSFVLFIAIPFATNFGDKQLIEAKVKTIESAVSYSINQAISLGRPVTLAPIVDDDWSQGARLYFDTQTNHRYQTGDKILREWHWGDKRFRLSWRGFLSDNYLVFSDRLMQSVLNGRFIVKNHKDKVMKELVINSLGRVRVV